MHRKKVLHKKKLNVTEPGLVPLILWFEVSRSTDRATEALNKLAKKIGTYTYYKLFPIFPPSRFPFPHGGKSKIFFLTYLLELNDHLMPKFCPDSKFRVKEMYNSVA